MMSLRTPANPSKSATARVLKGGGALPVPTCCNNCGGPVRVVNNAEIYGKPYGEWPWAYRCDDRVCDSYVGLHPFTALPLGTLAGKALRDLRSEAKDLFNPIWQEEYMTRAEAYRWLAEKLGIPQEQCHFGHFDADRCKVVMALLEACWVETEGQKRA